MLIKCDFYIQIKIVRPLLEKQVSLYDYVLSHSNYNASSAEQRFCGSTHNNFNKKYSILCASYYEKLYYFYNKYDN